MSIADWREANVRSGNTYTVNRIDMSNLPVARDKPLFTPGPLTTSTTVRQAMLRDLGSRDSEFIHIVRHVRERLLRVAGVSQQRGFEAIPMQGSGTFGIEAVCTCAVPPNGKTLIAVNGAYGDRIVRICQISGIDHEVIKYPEDQPVLAADIEHALAADKNITNISVVHCETTTGIINPIEAIGQVVRAQGGIYFVDSMSAFGAVPFDFEACEIDYLVSSANKCIEGVPGFSFVIARRERLLETEGRSRTLSFDLFEQWKGLEQNGQFRFTPPTHAILAFHQALIELEMEGGVEARAARYRNNCETLISGMREMGFTEYLEPELQGYIITSFRYPDHPRFDFQRFYDLLIDRGQVIYPGKVSNANCFRIGNIGRLFAADVLVLLAAIRQVLSEMELR